MYVVFLRYQRCMGNDGDITVLNHHHWPEWPFIFGLGGLAHMAALALGLSRAVQYTFQAFATTAI